MFTNDVNCHTQESMTVVTQWSSETPKSRSNNKYDTDDEQIDCFITVRRSKKWVPVACDASNIEPRAVWARTLRYHTHRRGLGRQSNDLSRRRRTYMSYSWPGY